MERGSHRARRPGHGGEGGGVSDLFRAWPFGDLAAGSYKLVLADPPWSFTTYSDKGLTKSPQAHYRCMRLPEIKALPVADLTLPDAVCIVWGTAPMLPELLATLAAWGFAYKSAGSWAKLSSTGRKTAFGPGYVYRSAAEFWVFGTRGKPEQLVRNVRNLIIAPVRGHSRKPDEMRTEALRQWGGPAVELFTRESSPGWSTWGDEKTKFDVVPTELPSSGPSEECAV
jgi:N6-adenosine-specific RNA methylase IME4